MTCAACASRVAKALRSLGVDDISVNCATVAAFRALGASPALVTRAVAAVKQAGYASSPDTARVEAEGEKAASDDPHVAKTTLATKGMICPSCPPRIQRALKRLDGVRDVTVFLVLDAVESNALAGRSRYLAVEALGSLLLATPVQFVLGFRFYVGAFNSLRYGTANMDVLVALGTSAAYFYSIYVLYEVSGNRPCCRKFRQCSDGGGGHGHHGSHADDADCVSGHHFFETSSVLIAFVLLGKFMEAKAKGGRRGAQALLSLQPKMATVSHTMDDGGDYEEVVDAGSLSRGDVVKIKPGEAVPADGAVVSGESNCDESMLTGESMPVEKRPADDDKEAAGKVYGGTINAGPGLVLHVGTRDLVAAAGGGRGALGPERDARAKALEADGATVVFVHAAVGGRLVADDFKATAKKRRRRVGDVVGMIGVADIIRDEAARVVSHLQSNLGIEVWMLTGDNGARPRPSRASAASRACSPRATSSPWSATASTTRRRARADLGVAIGAGAQIAVETADVVLIRSVLDDVATAIEVRLPPEVAALAMVLSSVSVVASSLSLRSYKPPSASPRAGSGDPAAAPAPCAAAPCASTAARTAPTRSSSGPARALVRGR
ncbi:cation-transporting ATPase [Aureococcus anophagefferens]|nr:cation-transporting ATPase [Aureococcus anophagefferens]